MRLFFLEIVVERKITTKKNYKKIGEALKIWPTKLHKKVLIYEFGTQHTHVSGYKIYSS